MNHVLKYYTKSTFITVQKIMTNGAWQQVAGVPLNLLMCRGDIIQSVHTTQSLSVSSEFWKACLTKYWHRPYVCVYAHTQLTCRWNGVGADQISLINHQYTHSGLTHTHDKGFCFYLGARPIHNLIKRCVCVLMKCTWSVPFLNICCLISVSRPWVEKHLYNHPLSQHTYTYRLLLQ